MITTQTPAYDSADRALVAHEVLEFAVSGDTLSITVGSWADADMTGKAQATTKLEYKLAHWSIELCDQLHDLVMAHPDWTGLEPVRPSPVHVFCWDSKMWVDPRSLSDVRATRWADVKLARYAAVTAPIVTEHGTFDASLVAQKSITDAILMLQTLEFLGTPQTIDFTLSDNTTATLTTAQMVQVGLALGAQTQAAYATARGLRAQIEAATTIAEAEVVVWPA